MTLSRHKMIRSALAGLMIVVLGLTLQGRFRHAYSLQSPLPTPTSPCLTRTIDDVTVEVLGYLPHNDGTVDITYRITKMGKRDISYIAFGLGDWAPVAPLDDADVFGELGSYHVEWTNEHGNPSFPSIKYETGFDGFSQGAKETFTITVSAFDPIMSVPVEIKAGKDRATFDLLLGDPACDRSPTPTPTPSPTPDSPLPTPTPGPVEPLDLQTDADGDGEPDELMAAIAYLDQLEAELDENPSPELAANLEVEFAQFARRLIFSERTQELQRQISQAYHNLPDPEDTVAFDAAFAEIRQMEDEIRQDPDFAIVDRIFTEQLDERLQTKAKNQNSQQAIQASSIDNTEAASQKLLEQEVYSFQTYLPITMFTLFAPNPACQDINSTGSGQANFDGLQRGDLMFFDGPSKIRSFAYGRKFTHMGMYDGEDNNNDEWIYESNAEYTDDVDGGPKLIQLDNTSYWKTWSGVCISLGHYDTEKISRENVNIALDSRKQQYGVNGEIPYPNEPPQDLQYWLNKNQDDKLYCSLLPWKVFDYEGLDIDSNDLGYRRWFVTRWAWVVTGIPAWEAGRRIVAPDEIYLHNDFIIDSEGLNPQE